jgi:hypothetical protein
VRVQRAFSLGWQTAQLYHYPVPLETLEPVPLTDELPGLSSFSDTRRYALLARTIAAGFTRLAVAPDPVQPPPSVAATLDALNKPGHTSQEVRQAALDLHVRLLEALNVADYRLGKAYGLGRALCEITSIPMITAHASKTTVLADLFRPERLLTITRWLAALKTDLPDHASYAVSRSLQAWSGQHQRLAKADLPATLTALGVQGRVWRVLLSGEKAAVDLLSAGDYVDAAEALLGRSRRLVTNVIRHFWWAIVGMLIVVAAVIVTVSLSGAFSSAGKLTTALLTLLAGLGVSVKGLSAAAGKIASKLEAPLWQSELDESVALAAVRLPHDRTVPRRHGDTVGLLRPPQRPANA